jgi:hypothetical protein
MNKIVITVVILFGFLCFESLAQSEELESRIIFSNDRTIQCDVMKEISLEKRNDRIFCGIQSYKIDSVKLIRLNGSVYISKNIKPKKSFMKANRLDISGPIKMYYIHTTSTHYYNGINGLQGPGKRSSLNYYFYLEGENMMFKNLKMRHIMKTLETSKDCSNMVKKLYRKRRASNILLIASGIGFAASGILLFQDEFNPMTPVLAGVSMISVWIGGHTKHKINKKHLPEAVRLYNRSF